MDGAALGAGAAIASAAFAGLSWFERRLDGAAHQRRERLRTVAEALRDVSRDAFASRYGGPNALHTTRLHLRAVVAAAGEDLPSCAAVAAAKSDLDIEQLEAAAFTEIGERLARS